MEATNFPRVSSVQFVVGARSMAQLPSEGLCEVAVAGRSNVGKSSLLRALLGTRKQVRVSRTPGRTREINFFRVESADLPPLFLVDLPGYGYASVPKSLQQEWGRFVTQYLETRASLRLLLLLMDARREITELETGFSQWMQSRGVRVVHVMTKMDQLPKTQWGQVEQRVRAAFGPGAGRPLLFSAVSELGVEDLWKQIARVATAAAAKTAQQE